MAAVAEAAVHSPSRAPLRSDGADDESIDDEQPLLAASSQADSPQPRAPAYSPTPACTAALLVVLLLALAAAVLVTTLDLESSGVDSRLDAAYSELLQRGRRVASESWQSVHSFAASWTQPNTPPLLPDVDPQRLQLAHCLGYATNIPPSPSHSTPNLSSSNATHSTAPHCPVAPSSVLRTFYSHYTQLYPSVLTYRPAFSCDRGTYLYVDWQYTDGMGNSLWAYSVVLAVAMALNATVLSAPFIATHVELEGHEERQRFFAFDEWEVARANWTACPANSSVKLHTYTLPSIFGEYAADDPNLLAARRWVRSVQVEQAAAANTTHLNAASDANASYRYLTPNFTWSTATLPRVDNDGPGLTVHLEALRIDGPWMLGLFAPGVEVAAVHEMRWTAQQLHWKAHTHPLEPITPAQAADSNATVAPPTATWLTSEAIHVAIPVRRGDVSNGTAGGQLMISWDLRARVMTDAAIATLLNQTLAVVLSIAANTSSPTAPASLRSAARPSFPVAYEPSPLSGAQILSRMVFTVYSEGSSADYDVITSALRSHGVDPSRIRLRLNQKTSPTFTLLSQSDLVLLSPSSFSYAAACYFNSEAVKVGSGWSFNRFAGCRNFVDAQWRRYSVDRAGQQYVPAAEVATPQWWGMSEEGEAELRRRLERLVARKERQRWSVEPLILDNWREDYPRRWMYDADRPQGMVELHAPRVVRNDTADKHTSSA